jgi:hypothetical protein
MKRVERENLCEILPFACPANIFIIIYGPRWNQVNTDEIMRRIMICTRKILSVQISRPQNYLYITLATICSHELLKLLLEDSPLARLAVAIRDPPSDLTRRTLTILIMLHINILVLLLHILLCSNAASGRHVSKFAVNLEPSKLAKELEGKIIIDSQVIILIFN